MADGASDGQLESRTAGYELAVPGGAGAGGRKVLGSRDFALFYRCTAASPAFVFDLHLASEKPNLQQACRTHQ